MKYIVVIAAIVTLVRAVFLAANVGVAIPHSYIVVLKDGHTYDSFKQRFDDIARRHCTPDDIHTIDHRFEMISGFAATVTNRAAFNELLAAPEIDYIEQDTAPRSTSFSVPLHRGAYPAYMRGI